jgi:hypothetical protein
LQASYRLRGPGWGFWALEISGWALLEDELAFCIADANPEGEGHSQVLPGGMGTLGWRCTSWIGTLWWSC